MTRLAAFAAAVTSIESLIAGEGVDPAIDPRCVPILLHHGRPTPRAVVLFHGFTNCPRQFSAFAQLLFARGDNVYVPRLPRHGLHDKLTTALDDLTVDELTACTQSAIGLARGLGDTTTLLGLSVGATMVAWAAQTVRVERAIAISPFFSVAHVSSLFEPVVAGALALAPNVHVWWDPRHREAIGPAHAYPRFPTHALARCLQLGQTIRDLARAAAPLSVHATLAINPKDPAIDIAAAREVWQLWRARDAAADEFDFDDLDARHDIIEPQTYAAAPTLVYPRLIELIER